MTNKNTRPTSAPVTSLSSSMRGKQVEPDMTYVTSRKPLQLRKAQLLGGISAEEELALRLMHPMRPASGRARPQSASVSAAAWRAYGSPSARGEPRPVKTQAMAPATYKPGVIPAMAGSMPNVGRLGGGFHYSQTQPPPASPKLRPSSPSGKAAGSQPLEKPPRLIRPESAPAAYYSSTVGGFDQSRVNSDQYRFAQTLPTDPDAKRFWTELLRKQSAGHSQPVSTGRPLRPRSAGPAAGSSGSAWGRSSVDAAPRRLSSSMVFMSHSLTPPTVLGFSEPEAELPLPQPNDSRFGHVYSRTSDRRLSRLTYQMKMPLYGSGASPRENWGDMKESNPLYSGAAVEQPQEAESHAELPPEGLWVTDMAVEPGQHEELAVQPELGRPGSLGSGHLRGPLSILPEEGEHTLEAEQEEEEQEEAHQGAQHHDHEAVRGQWLEPAELQEDVYAGEGQGYREGLSEQPAQHGVEETMGIQHGTEEPAAGEDPQEGEQGVASVGQDGRGDAAEPPIVWAYHGADAGYGQEGAPLEEGGIGHESNAILGAMVHA